MPPPSVEKRAPVFTTVDQLRPDTTGHNLVLKVRTVLGSDLLPVTLSISRSMMRQHRYAIVIGCGRQSRGQQIDWAGWLLCI